MSPTDFSFEPLFLGLPATAAALYAWTVRHGRPPAWRVSSFGAGLVLVAAPLNSPLETIAAHRLLLVHLLQNALIADIAPLLAGFYNWALNSGWALNIEHALLIAGGLLFWWPIVSGRLSIPAGLAYLGAGFVASSFLGLALIFSSKPLYSFYEHAPRLWGLSPERDQNLGGILMNAEQTVVFLLAIGWYVWRLLEEEHVSGAGESPAAR